MTTMTFSPAPALKRLNSKAMTAKKQLDEAEALKLLQFEQQAIPLMPKLFPAAMKETNNNRADAEDLLQETFAKAYRYWNSFEQGTNLNAWLSKILRNTAINRGMKEAKHAKVGDLDEMQDFQVGEAGHSVTARANLSAEAEALANLASNDVQDAVENLNPEFKTVVQMAIVDGYSYQEIADTLDIKIGTGMSRLHRGKKYLREALYTYAEQEGYDVSNAAKEAVVKQAKKGKTK
jgi:RNA polymerase sigma-70 factor (ECF subfamily)